MGNYLASNYLCPNHQFGGSHNQPASWHVRPCPKKGDCGWLEESHKEMD